jgi:SAM-dependent MidA family methyltransferase
MNSTHNPLTELIIQKIRNEGPITFRDYMEMCLYYPGLGYYTSRKEKIGTEGDFYTSPILTSLFGEMIGKQLEEMWTILGKKEFTVIEYGAGTGALCRDILTYLEQNEEFYAKLNYCIIEKSESMREKERSILTEKVRWISSPSELGKVSGCILSNELLDNFSVHKVVMKDGLKEVFVDHNGVFTEVLKPASNELVSYLEQLNVTLPEGFYTEINLQAIDWINEIAATLKEGFVLTIDYGYLAIELQNKSKGTLLCYNKHKVNDNPYISIGEQDITAHVNFTALQKWGEMKGLSSCGYTNQGYFLRGLGLTNHLRKAEQNQNANPTDKQKLFLIHTLLTDMGNKFKVLIQQKGLGKPQLSGLLFSQLYPAA